ncbi:hypothetical protein JCM10212_000700 [Sporobolomyces blumeae]
MLLGTALYRNLLKEAANLPDALASSYYRQQIRSHFRQDPVPESSLQAARRTKRAQKLLRNLQAANDGYLHALTRVLETAHGLRGPEKHAALAPYVLPGEQTKTFPPPLAALVSSPISHVTRAIPAAKLASPPTLPERADPSSEEARLVGPLPQCRIDAIKRRWWNLQTGKVRAPVALKVVQDGIELDDPSRASEVLQEVDDLFGLEHVDLEKGRGRLDLLESKATVPRPARPLPPRRLQTAEQKQDRHIPPQKASRPRLEDRDRRRSKPTSRNTKWHAPKQVTARLLRRRAAEMLDNAPVVVARVVRPNDKSARLTFEVKRSEMAKAEKGRYDEVGNDVARWLEVLGAQSKAGTGKAQRKRKE